MAKKTLLRAYLVELIGTFGLVYLAAGVVIVNYLTTPSGQQPATLNNHQPGLAGIALAQGLILGVLLAITVPVSGGYLNPAVTIMLWVFNRLESARAAWLLGAQLVGSALAGLCLRYTFKLELLREARMGAPHLNLTPEVFRGIDQATLLAGTGVEVVLTFLLVFAIFGMMRDSSEGVAALAGGATLAAVVFFGQPLTGAAVNPARWFGPVLWEMGLGGTPGPKPLADVFVYVAGPILGSLAAGWAAFRILGPGPQPWSDATAGAATTTIKVKK